MTTPDSWASSCLGQQSQMCSVINVEKKCYTYCSPVNEKAVEVQKHPSGLFGVGLLVEVSVEVAQLRIQG